MNNRFRIATLLVSLLCASATARAEQAWPQFRGSRGDGIVVNQKVPIRFSENENVVWKTALPGRGWSSPVIADGTIWVTTAIENVPTEQQRQALLSKNAVKPNKIGETAVVNSISLQAVAIDFDSGRLLKTIPLIEIENPDPIHSLNSFASPTPVIDGEHIYCHFGTFGTFCINRHRHEVIWQRRLPLQHGVGPGSSPFIYQDRLVLIQDGMDRQYVISLDKATGETAWETERPTIDAASEEMKKSYCTPILVSDHSGQEQLICLGAQWMVAYNPVDGSEIWRFNHGRGFSIVPRPLFHDDIVYFCTGYGKPNMWAVRVDGSGDVTDSHAVWQITKGIPAKPSPILDRGLIYVVEDNGIVSCFDAETGDEQWKKRIGGKHSASPILVNGHLYFGSQEGVVTVMSRESDGEVVAENQLDGQIMASPAVVDNALILRTDSAIYRIEE